MREPVAAERGLRTVAAFEAAKGAIVLLAGFGMLGLLHRDVRAIAAAFVSHLHLSPSGHAAGLFLEAAARVTDARLWLLATMAAAYSALRLTEALGLWRGRRWAVWLGAASGALYVPVEAYELWSRPSAVKAAALGANLLIVAYLAARLRRRGAAAQRQMR